MHVKVTLTDAMTTNHEPAGGWHVDDDGYLHIRGHMHGEGNIATYAPRTWVCVEWIGKKQRVDEFTIH